ncbi:MAG: S8 family serine peptidase [Alphaproteobacteria bacterium]|nr:S8 family serine peptidase [Alphaproteobacteria bacterium]
MTVLLALSALVSPAHALPKTPLVAAPIPADAPPWAHHVLTVKFCDDLGARASGDGGVIFAVPSDTAALDALIEAWELDFEQLLRSPEAAIDRVTARAEALTGQPQPDLRAMMRVRTPVDDPELLVAIGEALQALPAVEWAHIQVEGVAPPGDIAPTTPDYTASQTYIDPDPGVDAAYAHSLGLTGASVRLSDIEYGWVDSHEDLVDRSLNLESGQTVPSWVADNGWDEHGTAVLGETCAVDNAYGITGMITGATCATYPEYSDEEGARRATAITNAAADSVPGDVILLEMQANGNTGYGPAELDAAVFVATQTAVASGIVVVAAAGNGAQDLDDSYYSTYYLPWGDSGAIIVGAGSANTSHTPLSFTTYGSRVDVQGWGQSVFTLGYGYYAAHGNDPDQYYTHVFGGTSSASPIVASAAVLLQDYALTQTGSPLTPAGLRDLLVDTGVPQGSGVTIGPLPDLAAAIAALDDDGDGDLDQTYGGLDCDDADSAVNSAATEVWYDGLDADCDGLSDYDADLDGHDSDAWGGDDCDDADPAVNPSSAEVWYDGLDADCDSLSDYDADLDGHDSDTWGGDDCDDTAATTHPGATEVWYDGLDADCDRGSDYDADADGHDSEAWGGDDCDDADGAISPSAPEIWYDGVDADCAGDDDFDADADGYTRDDDCDDADAAAFPGAPDDWYDGVDADCAGDDDFDADLDGFDEDEDCDDADPAVNPEAVDVWYDGVDADCDGASDYDADADGHDSDAWSGDDCDDADPAIHPGAEEVWYDGVDADCAGDDDFDADADGYAQADDCDDDDPAVHPDASEVDGDGLDNDCDGVTDVPDGPDEKDTGRCSSAPGGGWWIAAMVGLGLRRRGANKGRNGADSSDT